MRSFWSVQDIEAFIAGLYGLSIDKLSITPYSYSFVVPAAIAANAAPFTGPLAITSSADFICTDLAWTDPASDSPQDSGLQVLIVDGTSGEQWTNTAADMFAIAAVRNDNPFVGTRPRPWAFPRFIGGNTSLIITLTNLSTGAVGALSELMFNGIQVRAL